MATENNHLIYALQSPSGRLYVGQTNGYDKRMYQHQKEVSGCPAISRAIKKHGWENIKHFILIEDLSLEEANYWEEHYISIFDCQAPNGYNLKSGGDNNLHCQITKDKISASHTGKKHTEKTKAKMSVARMGKQNALGCKHPPRTDESRVKYSAGATVAQNRHETRILSILTAQLQFHEKKLEAAGLL